RVVCLLVCPMRLPPRFCPNAELPRTHLATSGRQACDFGARLVPSITVKHGRSVHAVAYTLMSFRFVAMTRQKGMSECCARRQHHCWPLSPERKFGVSV